MFQSADEVLSYIRDEDVEFVDVRFCDLPGVMQHFTVPVESFAAEVFSEGLMFDGSSIRGFQAIHESDMLLLPGSLCVEPIEVAEQGVDHRVADEMDRVYPYPFVGEMPDRLRTRHKEEFR